MSIGEIKMMDWIFEVFSVLFDFFLWKNDEERSWMSYVSIIIAVLCVLAGIAGLVYWLFLR